MSKTTMAGQLRPPPSYDAQAKSYDQRVGLTEADCQQIAATVTAISRLQSDGLLIEVGAGTGQIGYWFTQTAGRYIGFDLSTGMLDEFRDRLAPSQYEWQLFQADGNEFWPAVDGSAQVIFSSRAIHLLNFEHVCRECHRLASPQGVYVIFGRVQRPKDSLQALMKKQLQAFLRERGFQPRQGERKQRQLLDVLTAQGAMPLDSVEVCRWSVGYQPEKSLAAWQQKAGLAGNDLPDDVKADILQDLRAWASAEFGSLEASVTSEEAYVLQGVQLKPGG